MPDKPDRTEGMRTSMRSLGYWKDHYVIERDANEIETKIKSTHFVSNSKDFELIYFEKDRDAPNVLISQGSGGHAYIFAELGYLIHLKGYNVFIMPKHGGHTINQLVRRHADALQYISGAFNSKIGVFAEGLGCYAAFYLAITGGDSMKSLACLNGPAILTENKFHDAILGGKGAAKRRKRLLPFVRLLAKIFPRITMSSTRILTLESSWMQR